MGSPSRHGRICRTRNSADDCGGRRLGGTITWTAASTASVADRKPLTDLTLIVFVRPLLGNTGVHIINGNVVNTKTAGFGLNEKAYE